MQEPFRSRPFYSFRRLALGFRVVSGSSLPGMTARPRVYGGSPTHVCEGAVSEAGEFFQVQGCECGREALQSAVKYPGNRKNGNVYLPMIGSKARRAGSDGSETYHRVQHGLVVGFVAFVRA